MTVVPFGSFRPALVRGRRSARVQGIAAVFAAVLVGALLLMDFEATASDASAAPASPPAAAPATAQAPTLSGRPTRITDGDTFRFGETRIRLHGVDAPEMSTEWGDDARDHLGLLIGAGDVRCTDTGERSYRRVVATCYAADGRDLAAAMVRAGWASDAPRHSRGRYAPEQREAVAAGRGVHRT